MNRLPVWLLAGIAFVFTLSLILPAVADDQAAAMTDTIRGQVQKILPDQRQLVLKDAQGREWTFQMDREATVRLNNKISQLGDLKNGDEVTISFVRMARDVNSHQAGEKGQQVACGQVQQVQADQNRLVIRDRNGKEWTFQLNQNAQIRREDKEQRLADLKAGDEVSVHYNQQGENLQAQQVRAHLQGQAAEVAQGQVQRVATDRQQLVLKDQQGQQRTFQIIPTAKVQVGNRESKLADLKAGDEVNVVYLLLAREVRKE